MVSTKVIYVIAAIAAIMFGFEVGVAGFQTALLSTPMTFINVTLGAFFVAVGTVMFIAGVYLFLVETGLHTPKQ